MRPRTTFRCAAMTAGLSGADEYGEAMMTCQYPAPPASTANARPRARPTREMLRPTGARGDGRIGAFGEPFIARSSVEQSGEAAASAPWRGGRLHAAVAECEQKAHDDGVREEARPAVRDER